MWSSGTWQDPGARLLVQDDGNTIIYRTDGTPAWDTKTAVATGPSASGDDMQPGEVLLPGQSPASANGRYVLTYQGDGNLVLYGPVGPLWDSQTAGRPVGVCLMQGDWEPHRLRTGKCIRLGLADRRQPRGPPPRPGRRQHRHLPHRQHPRLGAVHPGHRRAHPIRPPHRTPVRPLQAALTELFEERCAIARPLPQLTLTKRLVIGGQST